MQPAVPAAPPQIPDYELLRVVGQGSYGDVWLARSLTGIFRAVKIVWRDRFRDEQPYEREFNGLREFARVSISESRQLALLHVGRNDEAGFFYYVMELADDVQTGRAIDPRHYAPLTLKIFRDHARQLPMREVVAHAAELVRALASLHSHSLVHRDIKPSNIIFVEGRPKLADIGLVTNSTAAMSFIGTEGFVPPEGSGTPAADVYSLGKVLYELATGRDRNDFPRLPLHLEKRSDRKELMELNEVIVRACDPSPAARYPHAEAMLEELMLLQAGRSVRRIRLTERGLARARRAAVALTLVAAIAATGAHYERKRTEAERGAREAAEAKRDLLARRSIYSAALTQAQRALELRDFGRARAFLNEASPAEGSSGADLRGLEWHLLAHEARGDPAVTILPTGPAIERIFARPDGGAFAIHDAKKFIRIHRGGSPARPLVSNAHRLAGFSPSGAWLFGTTADFRLQAWSAATGQPLAEPQGDGVNRPLAPISTAEGQVLAFTDGDRSRPPALRTWDLLARREVARLDLKLTAEGRWEFFLAAVSRDSRRAALVLMSGRKNDVIFRELHVDLPRLSVRRDVITTHRRGAIALSSDGRLLARANANLAEVEILDLETGRTRWTRNLDHVDVGALAFDPRGDLLAAGTHDGKLHLVAADDGRVLQRLMGQAASIGTMAWSPDGSSILTGGSGGDVRAWQAPFHGARRHRDGLWRSSTWRIACSPQGDFVAASLDEATVGVFRTPGLELVGSLPGAQQVVAFSRDGSRVITLDPAGNVQWWQVGDASPSHELKLLWTSGRTMHARVDAAERVLIATSSTGQLQIWDLPTRHLRAVIDAHQGSIRHAALSPDGSTAATAGPDGAVRFWDLSQPSLRFSVSLPPPVLGLSLSNGAKWLAAAAGTGDVLVIHVPHQRMERWISLGAAATVTCFSADDSRLICASRKGLLHLYDTTEWREMTALEERLRPGSGDSSIAAISASGNGRLLATLGRSGRLRIWQRD